MPRKRAPKNRKSKGSSNQVKRNLLLKDDMQEYGQVTKVLGGRQFTITFQGGTTKIGIVRSKRLRISNEMFVLVSLRDFDEKRCDIIHKYTPDEVRKLQKEHGIKLGTDKDVDSDGEKLNDENDFGFDFEDI